MAGGWHVRGSGNNIQILHTSLSLGNEHLLLIHGLEHNIFNQYL